MARLATETVFLDAGGVLVHPNWSRVSAALERQGVAARADALGAADVRARRRLDDPELIRRMTDDTRGAVYFELVLEEVGVERSERTEAAIEELRSYHNRSNLWENVPSEAAPALERLRAAGRRLVVVSNANGTLHANLERLGLLERFDVVLDSHREGVEKPDPRFFELALERSGARRESTLHVGDLYHVDVVGARSAGLRAALFDAGGLYEGIDCPRVGSLTELAQAVEAGSL